MDTIDRRSSEPKNALLIIVLVVNALCVYFVGLLLFVSKWLPHRSF
jgi:hypothetical protein